ncbi:hypothetical protein LOS24_00280 [Enterococcus faecium]|nr:hypothetical protein [Enterococcus faecium]
MPAKNVSLEEIAEETVRQIQPEWRLLYPEENKTQSTHYYLLHWNRYGGPLK